MSDDLPDDEREALEKYRAGKKAEKVKADEGLRVQIFGADGSGAELPYAKAKKWLGDKFGIDLDDEPVQDESGSDEPEGGGTVKRFAAGRRVG